MIAAARRRPSVRPSRRRHGGTREGSSRSVRAPRAPGRRGRDTLATSPAPSRAQGRRASRSRARSPATPSRATACRRRGRSPARGRARSRHASGQRALQHGGARSVACVDEGCRTSRSGRASLAGQTGPRRSTFARAGRAHRRPRARRPLVRRCAGDDSRARAARDGGSWSSSAPRLSPCDAHGANLRASSSATGRRTACGGATSARWTRCGRRPRGP